MEAVPAPEHANDFPDAQFPEVPHSPGCLARRTCRVAPLAWLRCLPAWPDPA